MGFVFERLKEGDIDASLKVVTATLGSQAKEYAESATLRRMILGEQIMTLVAKKEERIVGLVNAHLLGIPKIMFLTVADEKSAKEGLADLLIEKIVEGIKSALPAVKRVLHNEFADNFSAVGLYSVKGFRVTGYVKDPVTNRDVLFMEKTIQ
ncbi:MAG: GNAT family N-acetyltransferase [Dehalococcoidia bacterium]|nr:GNAT family N-acetyltransferase [Dehalococcoidia bacterium]